MPRRLVDPAAAIRDYPAERLGYRSDADQRRGQIARDRNMDSSKKQRIVRMGSLPLMYRENLTSGDATYTVRLGTPSAATTWGETAIATKMPRAGKVTGGYLYSSEARTTGTATLAVRIVEGGVTTDYLLTDCVLNATDTLSASADLDDAKGIPFAEGATLDGRIVTVSWGPTTADHLCQINVSFEES